MTPILEFIQWSPILDAFSGIYVLVANSGRLFRNLYIGRQFWTLFPEFIYWSPILDAFSGIYILVAQTGKLQVKAPICNRSRICTYKKTKVYFLPQSECSFRQSQLTRLSIIKSQNYLFNRVTEKKKHYSYKMRYRYFPGTLPFYFKLHKFITN